MSINRESDQAANIQIGPTTHGMVRIYVSGQDIDIPMDFDPDEADEIAAELMASAAKARAMAAKPKTESAKESLSSPKRTRRC